MRNEATVAGGAVGTTNGCPLWGRDLVPRPVVEHAVLRLGLGGLSDVALEISLEYLLRSPQRPLTGAVATFIGLSRIKELERERQRAERLASLEAIASGMVHEIRNPLVAIKTFTQMLSKFRDLDYFPDDRRTLGREINRVEGLLDRLQMLSTPFRQPMEPIDVTVPLDMARGTGHYSPASQARHLPPNILGNSFLSAGAASSTCA